MNPTNQWLRSLQTSLTVWLMFWSNVVGASDAPDANKANVYLPVVVVQAQPGGTIPLTPKPPQNVTPTATSKPPKATATPRSPKATPAPGATATPSGPPVQPPANPSAGIWISAAELATLPTSGTAWDLLKEAADQSAPAPNLSNQDDDANSLVLAKALVYARTGEQSYRDQVVAALQVITFNNTEDRGRTLALGRELAAYVIAADLIDLPHYQPELDGQFRSKLRELLDKNLDGDTLRSTHEQRPNNWGTHAGASRAAIAVYLGDQAELARVAQVFQGYLGNRAAYADFKYNDDLSWQADPNNPVGINPAGASKDGHSIDGALPEEMRRGGSFQVPPGQTNYPWEGLQGAVVQAEILHRAGYPAWEWENRALLRAAQYLYTTINWPADNDDKWQPWLLNYRYGVSFATDESAHSGKNMGWTNWTHAR